MRLPGYALLRPAIFRLDPEFAHHRAIEAAAIAQWLLSAAARLGIQSEGANRPRLEQSILGLKFPNPIGLAAGFDKNAVAPHLWPALGFGFAELGTVTALPQEGNPRPRLFRLPEDQALINRLGFNNAGAETVATRLEQALVNRPQAPIGVNIGASRKRVGDAEAEAADYRESARKLARLGDYVTVNVSSPNTPGLRDLQAPHRLAAIVTAVREGMEESAPHSAEAPLFVKLSPDLSVDDVAEICAAAMGAGAGGFIATNTTLAREGLRSPHHDQPGGLSGIPLREISNQIIVRLRREVGSAVPIIGIGGVTSLADVLEKFEAGANLVALYSALVYEGPLLARRLARELDAYLGRIGLGSVAELGRHGSDGS